MNPWFTKYCKNITLHIQCPWLHITMTSYWARWRPKPPADDCLLDRLFQYRSRETLKLRVTGLCEGNSPVTGEFPTQRASNAEMFLFDDVIMNQDLVGHFDQRNLISGHWVPNNQQIGTETKWPPFCRRHFQSNFLNENFRTLIEIFSRVPLTIRQHRFM